MTKISELCTCEADGQTALIDTENRVFCSKCNKVIYVEDDLDEDGFVRPALLENLDFNLKKTDYIYECLYNNKKYILTMTDWEKGDIIYDVKREDGKIVDNALHYRITRMFINWWSKIE